MKILIVDDDFINRRLLQRYLSRFGECDIAVDGEEALDAFNIAWQEGSPYQLICLDIMMPKMDGQEALKQIRQLETERGIGIGEPESAKILMTTALDGRTDILDAFKTGAEGYVVKPIQLDKLQEEIRKLQLIE